MERLDGESRRRRRKQWIERGFGRDEWMSGLNGEWSDCVVGGDCVWVQGLGFCEIAILRAPAWRREGESCEWCDGQQGAKKIEI